MLRGSSDAGQVELDDFIEAYESTRARDGQADLADFLPWPAHPLRGAVLRELVRVDLEYSWEQGQPRTVQDYLGRFPELAADRAALRAIAFEEYRLRQQAGQDPAAAEYQELFGGGSADWPQPPHRDFRPGPDEAAADSGSLPRGAAGDLPPADRPASRLARTTLAFPEVGSEFAGFRLVAELGRGAFGRVYLATQGHLANRPVALKISVDLFGESQTLARLQHTHIVPIYSVHQEGPFQAVCMPYFGATTLADVRANVRAAAAPPDSGKSVTATLRRRQGAEPDAVSQANDAPAALQLLEGMTYVQAVLWIGVRLADGLAHAHERGILHQDLKPANILLTDEGQPMLLDFNLSSDTRRRGGREAAQIGGTLPYMSPEQLDAFRGSDRVADARSDLFSLGVILYEMLTGQLPFGTQRDRPDGPVPPLRRWNRAVSPAVESIVRHCLAADPGCRYQTAQQLRVDLQRQLDDRPLRYAPEPSLRERARKWVRRHPRLTSPVTVLPTLVILLALLAAPAAWQAWERYQLEENNRLVEEQTRRLTVQKKRSARLLADKQNELEEQTRLKHIARMRSAALRRFDEFRKEAAPLSRFEDRLNLREFAGPGLTAADDLERDTVLSRRVLKRYRLPKSDAWDCFPDVEYLPPAQQVELREQVGDLLYLLARAELLQRAAQLERTSAREPRRRVLQPVLRLNALAIACFAGKDVPRSFLNQCDALAGLLVPGSKGKEAAVRAGTGKGHSVRELCRDAYEYARRMNRRSLHKAVELLEDATRKAPQNFSGWLLLAGCHQNLSEYAEAAACYCTCIALEPGFIPCYYWRGHMYLRQKRWTRARDDFKTVGKAQPSFAPAHSSLASAWLGLKKYARALAELDAALKIQPAHVAILSLRAEVRQASGDPDGARRDREAVARGRPTDAEGWSLRGLARAGDDPQGALADFDEALKLDPRCRLALFHKARILSNLRGRVREALQVLDRTVAFYPEDAEVRMKRGLLRALLGQRADAHLDADEAVTLAPTGAMQYQAACIYAATSLKHTRDRAYAIRLLFKALRQGYGIERIETDVALAPLHQEPEFELLRGVVRVLRTRGSE